MQTCVHWTLNTVIFQWNIQIFNVKLAAISWMTAVWLWRLQLSAMRCRGELRWDEEGRSGNNTVSHAPALFCSYHVKILLFSSQKSFTVVLYNPERLLARWAHEVGRPLVWRRGQPFISMCCQYFFFQFKSDFFKNERKTANNTTTSWFSVLHTYFWITTQFHHVCFRSVRWRLRSRIQASGLQTKNFELVGWNKIIKNFFSLTSLNWSLEVSWINELFLAL